MSQPHPIELDNAAELIANALATRLEKAGMQTFDLRKLIKSSLITFWLTGKTTGQRSEIQSVIGLLQNSADVHIISNTINGGSASISLQETLLGRAKDLETA